MEAGFLWHDTIFRMNDEPKKENKDWEKKLTPEQYHVLREKGTEQPFSGKYVHHKEKGLYKCVACGNELFSSDTKFDSGTGWPSFTDPMNKENIILKEDTSLGMNPVRSRTRSQIITRTKGLLETIATFSLNKSSRTRSATSNGMNRTEIKCKRCGSHLGHVFPDGPGASGNRYCINSVCLVHEK